MSERDEIAEFVSRSRASLSKSRKSLGLFRKDGISPEDFECLDDTISATNDVSAEDQLLAQVELSEDIFDNADRYQEMHRRAIKARDKRWARIVHDTHKDCILSFIIIIVTLTIIYFLTLDMINQLLMLLFLN